MGFAFGKLFSLTALIKDKEAISNNAQ